MTTTIHQFHVNPTDERAAMLARVDLANPYELHRTVLSLIPGDVEGNKREQTRTLHRLTTAQDGGELNLFVQSEASLDVEAVPYLVHQGSRDIELSLQNLNEGDRIRVDLVAAPSFSQAPAAKGQRGRKCVIKTLGGAQDWWLKRAETMGFDALRDETGVRLLRVDPLRRTSGEKTDDDGKVHRFSHHPFKFSTIATLRDRDAFSSAVKNGVGTAKAFGMGLVTFNVLPG